jgi:hypothetical protein
MAAVAAPRTTRTTGCRSLRRRNRPSTDHVGGPAATGKPRPAPRRGRGGLRCYLERTTGFEPVTLTLARVGARSWAHIRKAHRLETVANKGLFSCRLSVARQVSGWLADFLRTLSAEVQALSVETASRTPGRSGQRRSCSPAIVQV